MSEMVTPSAAAWTNKAPESLQSIEKEIPLLSSCSSVETNRPARGGKWFSVWEREVSNRWISAVCFSRGPALGLGKRSPFWMEPTRRSRRSHGVNSIFWVFPLRFAVWTLVLEMWCLPLLFWINLSIQILVEALVEFMFSVRFKINWD